MVQIKYYKSKNIFSDISFNVLNDMTLYIIRSRK